MSVTALRKNLYKVVDQVLETGIPVEVERRGRTVLISAAEPARSKLSRLVRRDTIVGDPDDLVTLKVSEWREPEDLD
jgi:prevent-host-death family protein